MDLSVSYPSATEIQNAVLEVADYTPDNGMGSVHMPDSLSEPDGYIHWAAGKTVTIPCGVNLIGPSLAGCMSHQYNWQHYIPTLKFHSDQQNIPSMTPLFILDGSDENNKPSRIAGFQTNIDNPPQNSESTSGGNGWIWLKAAKNFRLDHITSLNWASRHIMATANPVRWGSPAGYSTYGVIDHCWLDAPYKDTPGDWWVSYGIATSGDITPDIPWVPDLQKTYAGKYQAIPGVALVYMEDNHFQRLRHSTDGSNGNANVVRYNLFDRLADEHEALWNSGEVCSHPYWVGGQYPPAWTEIYHNVFRNPNMHRDCPDHPNQPHSLSAIVIRGSTALIFENEYSQAETAPNYQSIFVYLRDESQDKTVDRIHDVYIWGNTYTNVFNADVNGDGVIDGYVKVGTDGNPVLNQYWFLRQPSLAIDGWEYTPYIYPHPRTLEGPIHTLDVQANIAAAIQVVIDGYSGPAPFGGEFAEGTHQVSVDEYVET